LSSLPGSERFLGHSGESKSTFMVEEAGDKGNEGHAMMGIIRRSLFRVCALIGILAVLALPGGCHEEETPSPAGTPVFLEVFGGNDQVGGTGRELPEPIEVRAVDVEGNPLEGVPVRFEVTAGGGSLSPTSLPTDDAGAASVRWTLGIAPVGNRVKAASGNSEVEFTAQADPGERPALEVVLPAKGFDFAYEDLAFEEGRGLFLGAPGTLLNQAAPEADPVPVELEGEAIVSPAGIAFGPSGDLYVCENDDPPNTVVKRVRPSGLCEVLSDGYGGEPFALPNYIAVHSSGQIYVTDTCRNRIFRISPVGGETTEFLSIPGPNGIAFDPQETYLYILTENPLFFCQGENVWGGLFRVAVSPEGEAGPIEPLVEGYAVAGDGLAFDAEGNLYVVFSGLRPGGRLNRLLESGVFVYTPEGRFNEFFTVRIPADIITNIAFGVEPFEPTSLYCYGFTGRLYRVKVGIRGRPLP
jgi:sugar lactone lactonase YvrE